MTKGIVFDISAVGSSIVGLVSNAVRAEVKLAVYGAENAGELDMALEKAGLCASDFDCIVYAKEVERGKPHGDAYRYCTLKLGLSHEECVVVETSVDGHRAAKDALCRSIGIFGGIGNASFEDQLEAGADILYKSLFQFPAFSSLEEFDGLILSETKAFYDKTIIGDLLFNALDVQNNAYAPYSKFKVGAALLTENGNIYKGCNVENASFGGTICAERGAAMAAIAAEGKTALKLLAVASSGDDPAPPCALCRQFLSEFMSPYAQVYMISSTSGVVRHYSFGTLMPCSFTEF